MAASAPVAVLRSREVRISETELIVLGYSHERYRASYFFVHKRKGGLRLERVTADDPELLRCIEKLADAGETKLAAKTIEHYIRTTSWGAELP